MTAMMTPIAVTADMIRRDRGDEWVAAVGPRVVQHRAHDLGGRGPHEDGGGELMGEEHEHESRRAA